MVRALNVKNQGDLTENGIRIWKCHSSVNSAKSFAEYLKMKKIGGPDTEFEDQTSEEFEENTGVQFPGKSIRHLFNSNFKDTGYQNTGINPNFDFFVVEQATSQG